MRRYELGGWILVAAMAALGCSGSSSAGLGTSKDGGLGGSVCTANNDCSSGLCLGGSCASGKPGGGTCKTAADCASGVCQGGACVGNGQGVPSGSGCQSNDQCASGTCTSGKCVAGSGLPDGKSCGALSECASGACTNGVCGTGTGIGGGTGGAGTGTGGEGTSSGGAGTGNGGTGTSGATGTGGAKTGTGGAAAGGCTPGTTQCTDCIDNDGDGKIDSADPECTGPLDNDEATFATGIPGDNVDPKWQDCFFDGNSGGGDDGCRYNTGCLTGALAQTDPSCVTSQQCQTFCKRLVPNGCDCFGCCAVPLPGGGTKNIFIQNSCTLADINDPTKCPTCVQSAGCTNTCQHCELCVGKDTLPADCTPPPGTGGAGGAGGATNTGGTNVGGTNVGGAGGTPNTGGAGGTPCPTPLCPAPQQPCGLSCLPACAGATYCLTGCCVPSIF